MAGGLCTFRQVPLWTRPITHGQYLGSKLEQEAWPEILGFSSLTKLLASCADIAQVTPTSKFCTHIFPARLTCGQALRATWANCRFPYAASWTPPQQRSMFLLIMWNRHPKRGSNTTWSTQPLSTRSFTSLWNPCRRWYAYSIALCSWMSL